MAVPMDWSIVEPMVGILVSSLPAIRSALYLLTPQHAHHSTHNRDGMSSSKTKSQHGLQEGYLNARRCITDVRVGGNGDSEEGLVGGYVGEGIGVTRTLDVHITQI